MDADTDAIGDGRGEPASDDGAGTRHRVASMADLAEDGSRVIVEVEGQEVAVFRVDGELHALPNFCPHQAAPLCEGELTGRMVVGSDGWEWEYVQEGEIVTCPWHGWKFDVTTGKNIKDEAVAIPTYDVEVDGDDVYVVR
ncbi:MAG: Rieske (2Fe-2S) protein [Haloferacaceae archaeon]